MIKVMAVIVILVFIHPHKVFDPEDCLGICLHSGAVPTEQTLIIDDEAQL